MITQFDLSRIREYRYYAENLLKIKILDPESIIPFALNPIQVRLDATVEHLFKTVGYVKIMVLKARREGLSTYIESRIFHRVHTTSNTQAFIIAHNKKSLNTIFSMSKLFYECLPASLRPMTRFYSKNELVFENPSDKNRLIEPGLRSQIEVYSARRMEDLRSAGYTYGHLSEAAFYPDGSEVAANVIPTIPNSPGTFLAIESTANGQGDYFHEKWKEAKKKRNNFYPIFFSWLEFPKYSMPFPSIEMKGDLLATLEPEEGYLIKKYKATPEQLFWRRFMIKEFDGDVELFHQEYPTTDKEAFISSGKCYFNRNKLVKLRESTIIDPIFIGDISEYGLIENEDGPLKIWEMPLPGRDYVLGADTTGGVEGGNCAGMEVVLVPQGDFVVTQVAEYKEIIDPVLFARKIALLGNYYNEALASPEINNHGLTTLTQLKDIYWNLYRWQYFDKLGKYHTDKLGWDNNMSTKSFLCDYTSACLNLDYLVIRSSDLIDQMYSFIRVLYESGRDSGTADRGGEDDLVIAFMIATFVLGHSFDESSLLRTMAAKLKPFTVEALSNPPEMKFKKPEDDDSWMRDVTMHESDDYYQGKNAWLNM